MRAKDILSSQTRAFSLFELLVCIAILSILLLIAIPKVTSFAYQRCLFELREKLNRAHYSLLELYSSKALRGESMGDLDGVFLALTQKEGNCYFQRSSNGLVAYIEGKKLDFLISPIDFSTKPKIYCQLSNETCRDFLGKTSKK